MEVEGGGAHTNTDLQNKNQDCPFNKRHSKKETDSGSSRMERSVVIARQKWKVDEASVNFMCVGMAV